MKALRPSGLLIMVAVLALSGCAGTTAQSEDGARMQIVNEVRGDLKAAPGDVPIRMLGITPPAYPKDPGEMEGSVQPLPVDEDSAAELEAIALAQSAELELLAGKQQEALAMLEASMRLHPTLDAFEPLLEVLLERDTLDSVAEHCRVLRKRLPPTRIDELLRLCHRADRSGQQLPWADESDRARLRVLQAETPP